MPFSKKPEVMSPAGHWPQLHAAIEAGADACYFGLKHFSARAKVGFELSELPEAMRTLHRRGVRGYLTFNTLVFEHELAEAARAIAAIAEAGVDALIVQDIGVLKLARQIAPDLELHASTQTSITSAEGVEFALSQGADRVTLARELSLEEVAAIYEKTKADLEIFVHGALCVAYSGQCFSSEAWGGRSANRGQCAQACRLPYELLVDGATKPLADARYLLSPGDLSVLRHVPQIIAAGVSCMKIEGRYKDSDYVALTTQAYRRAVDDAWAGRASSLTARQELELEQVYSRGLGPYFISGVNHQSVVNGRSPRHRGVHISTVTAVRDMSVIVQPAPAHEIAPLKAGDGVVFDAADWRSPQEDEEGGRVYHVSPNLDGTLELSFANHAVNFRRIRAGDLLWRTHDPELDRTVRRFLDPAAPVAKQLLAVHVTAAENQRLHACWTLPSGLSVTVESPAPLSVAQNRGITEESLREQFARLGNTPYELSELSAEITGSVFVPASLANRVRREAVEKLEELQSRPPARSIHPTPDLRREKRVSSAAAAQLHLLVRNPDQLEAAITARPDSITLDYLDLYGLRPSVERVKASGLQARVASPRILKPGESRIVQFLTSLHCPILVRSTGMLHTLKQSVDQPLIGDFSLNAANTLTAEAYLDIGTPSPHADARPERRPSRGARCDNRSGSIGSHRLSTSPRLPHRALRLLPVSFHGHYLPRLRASLRAASRCPAGFARPRASRDGRRGLPQYGIWSGGATGKRALGFLARRGHSPLSIGIRPRIRARVATGDIRVPGVSRGQNERGTTRERTEADRSGWSHRRKPLRARRFRALPHPAINGGYPQSWIAALERWPRAALPEKARYLFVDSARRQNGAGRDCGRMSEA